MADGVSGESLTVETGCRSPFPLSGGVEVGALGQAKSIAEQGAQQERGGWAAPMGPHHLLKGIVGTSRDVPCWVQPGAVLLQEFGELQGSRYCRPPFPRPWPWKIPRQPRWMKRPISCRPFRATRDTWLWVCMPTREAFRTVQHAVGMHLLSVGTRNRCP